MVFALCLSLNLSNTFGVLLVCPVFACVLYAHVIPVCPFCAYMVIYNNHFSWTSLAINQTINDNNIWLSRYSGATAANALACSLQFYSSWTLISCSLIQIALWDSGPGSPLMIHQKNCHRNCHTKMEKLSVPVYDKSSVLEWEIWFTAYSYYA